MQSKYHTAFATDVFDWDTVMKYRASAMPFCCSLFCTAIYLVHNVNKVNNKMCVWSALHLPVFLLSWHFSTEFLFRIDLQGDYISIICYEIIPALFEENYYELIKLSFLNVSAKKKYAVNELISNQCNSAMVPIRISPVLYIQNCFLTNFNLTDSMYFIFISLFNFMKIFLQGFFLSSHPWLWSS